MKRKSTWVAVLAAICGFAVAQDALELNTQAIQKRAREIAVMAAIEAGVKTDAQLRGALDYIEPEADELKWREIPWIPDLWRGRIEAAQQEKPMFIWAMNGDPLGCV